MLQMVYENLRQVPVADNGLWGMVCSKSFFHRSYISRRVQDPAFPGLSPVSRLTIFKHSVTGMANQLQVNAVTSQSWKIK